MIFYSHRFLSYGLIFYDEKTDNFNKIDILRKDQCKKRHWFSYPFTTLHINLEVDESALFDAFEKNTKYEISRALTKDGIVVKELNFPENKDFFYSLYNSFADSKGLSHIGEAETDLLIDAGLFKARAAYSADGELLVIHTYITINSRARLAHSISFFRDSEENAKRNLIGRANRFLHWEDIKYFKSNNFSVYDLGGISTDTANREAMFINKFKESFGGLVVTEYNSLVPLTIKGFAALLAKKIRVILK